MKNILRYLLAFAACGTAALAVHAQQPPKIVVVDMAKLYDSYYKTVDQMTKMKADEASAQAQYDQMTKDGQALVEQYKALDETVKNPLTSPEAKAKAQEDQQKKGQEIQAKMNDRTQFSATVQREFQQRIQNFHGMMMQEIGAKAVEIAKAQGATLILDKSGIGVLGSLNVIYSDPSYDITAEVQAELNKDKPAEPAAAPSAGSSAIPQITVPGISPAPSK